MKNFLKFEDEYQLNEILFENRNKNYGAYVLRNEEGNILVKSLLVGVAFFATLAITPLILNSFKAPVPVIIPNGGHVFTPIEETPEKPPVIIKPIVPIKKIEATVAVTLPTPVRDSKNQTPAKTKNEIQNANIGIKDIAGDPPTLQNPPVVIQGPVTVPQVATVIPVDNNPITRVDIEAKFNGGIDAFRNKVIQNFSTGKFEGSGDIIKTTVTFIVEKDGSISAITAKGTDAKFNAEAEKTIREIRGKWQPAKLKGENVRSYFNFPIAMQFE